MKLLIRSSSKDTLYFNGKPVRSVVQNRSHRKRIDKDEDLESHLLRHGLLEWLISLDWCFAFIYVQGEAESGMYKHFE